MGTKRSQFTQNRNFAAVPTANVERSSFDRSHGNKTTFDAGDLIPILWDEVLPGDTINCVLSTYARLATPIFPIMDNMTLDTFYFAVPVRLLWDNFQKFMGEQRNPGDSVDFTVPEVTSGGAGFLEDSISDYLGIPTKTPNALTVNSLHHRAYNLIWNEWFRSEDLQNSVPNPVDDGPDLLSDFAILKRGKRHDYFTSCLPFPQKGDSVLLPLSGAAPVTSTGDGIPSFQFSTDPSGNLINVAASQATGFSATATTGNQDAEWENTKLEADMDGVVGGPTINEFRNAFAIQRLFERDARGGTRYTEIIRSHFKISSPDQRLQRPEYLGGGSQTVGITPVPASVAAVRPLGDLAGYGVATGTGNGFTKSFTEHCVIIGLVCLRADLNYQQGLPRMYSRQTKLDYYWGALSHIGEQAVLNKEIFAQGDANDDLTFGFQARYDEYRHKPSSVTSRFRSNATVPLDQWHLAQEFGALPVLGASFIEENPPIDRVIAVPAEPHIILDCWFKYIHARPMPTHGVPGMIDHF